jgi:hypothetical protein
MNSIAPPHMLRAVINNKVFYKELPHSAANLQYRSVLYPESVGQQNLLFTGHLKNAREKPPTPGCRRVIGAYLQYTSRPPRTA